MSRRAAALLVVFALGALPAQAPSPYAAPGPAVPKNGVDLHVFARLRELGIEPAPPCSDAVFVRRVFLDAIGTLPTADEVRAFLADRSADRRERLIDALLARPEFADYQAMHWADTLRVKAEFPVNLWPNAAQAYHRWLRDAIAKNRPFDAWGRELLLATGSNFRDPAVNFWRSAAERTPAGLGRAVALLFLGSRADRWPQPLQQGFGAFCARVAWKGTQEWKEEIVYVDLAKAAPARAVWPDGTAVDLPAAGDPRGVLADRLFGGAEPPAAPVVCNRIWYWLCGRGIVHEPDDFRADNPPANPALLRFLAGELVAAHWDLQRVYRLVLGSQTYQLAPLPPGPDPAAAANFASYPLRRLEAEVLIDALCQLTATTESYQSAIPEPYTVMPDGTRAIALPDGSIGSAVLELFGKPARDTGLAAERPAEVTAAQRLHLLNSSHVQKKLENGRLLAGLLRRGGEPARAIDELYLTILSRQPTADERAAVQRAFAGSKAPREVALDVAWALLNSSEFLFRH